MRTTRDLEKPWLLIASWAMVPIFLAVACLLIRDATAPADASWPAADPAHPARSVVASTVAVEEALIPARRGLAGQSPGSPPPDRDAAEPISAPEQRAFEARRPLETIDPRELLRAAVPPTRP